MEIESNEPSKPRIYEKVDDQIIGFANFSAKDKKFEIPLSNYFIKFQNIKKMLNNFQKNWPSQLRRNRNQITEVGLQVSHLRLIDLI